MRKILKWIGIGLLALLGVILLAGIAAVLIGNSKINKQYDIQTAELTIPTDAASIAEGKRLATIRGCVDCHSSNYAGELLFEDPALGKFYPVNLTTGEGGLQDYSPADWERAIRHGLNQEGKPIMIMPSNDYNRISDEQVAQMIAYLQTLDPVDQSWPETTLGPLARVLVGLGQFPVAAALIDHSVVPPASVKAEVSAVYGAYLTDSCIGCHKPDFSGGPMIGSGADDPVPSNLTRAGNLANWTQEEFIHALRTGITPEGKELNSDFMPWPVFTLMTDDELAAVWLHLSTVPAVETPQ